MSKSLLGDCNHLFLPYFILRFNKIYTHFYYKKWSVYCNLRKASVEQSQKGVQILLVASLVAMYYHFNSSNMQIEHNLRCKITNFLVVCEGGSCPHTQKHKSYIHVCMYCLNKNKTQINRISFILPTLRSNFKCKLLIKARFINF
jgi:hypothetical protein